MRLSRSRLSRLLTAVQSPPPWLWCAHGRLWQRLGPHCWWRLPFELLQQIHGWGTRPFPLRLRCKLQPPVPRSLFWYACWLNSYWPDELAWWQALGLSRWQELSRQRPESLTGAIHAQRRLPWPDQCRLAVDLLADKAALLELTPEPWRSPFLLLEGRGVGSSVLPQPEPAWWQQALMGAGLVLKPQHGYGGRAVIRFQWVNGGLAQQTFFRRLQADAPSYKGPRPGPRELMEHWQRLCGSSDAALAAPYLSHSSDLPAAEPSTVLRVITARQAPDAPALVQMAWLQVLLGEELVAYIGLDGRALPQPGEPLLAAQLQSLQQWQGQLQGYLPPSIQACLNAAIAMHQLLPPIDQVAWDWIPAGPQPQLLEGNSGFGLLVPQMFEKLKAMAR